MSEQPRIPQQTLALLLGASTFPAAPSLAEGPVFYNSARGFQEYLISPEGLGLPTDNVNWLFDDSRSPHAQLLEIGDFIERRTAVLNDQGIKPTDLIIFYSGNLLVSGPDQAPYFAIKSTQQESEHVTSLRASDLASVVKADDRFLRKFLILDYCFSQAAHKEFEYDPMAPGRVMHEFPEGSTAILGAANLGH